MPNKLFISISILFIPVLFLFSTDLDSSVIDALNKNKLLKVKLLLKKGANINIQDNNGNTLLINAIEKGYIILAGYLINNNAGLDIKNKNGKTAMDTAVDKKNDSVIDMIKDRININNAKSKISSLNEFDFTGIDNLGVFDLKYNGKKINIKFLTKFIFAVERTDFTVTVDQIKFSGELVVKGIKLDKNELRFIINNHNLQSKFKIEDCNSNINCNRKFTVSTNISGVNFEGEIIEKVYDDNVLYLYNLDKAENKLSGIRYYEKNQYFYDIKIDDNIFTGKKSNKGEYMIKTDIKEGFLYLLLIFDIYFDYLNNQKVDNKNHRL
ncbi:MAG: ankyrin repeat domain-containing protein [Spirochaetes bacterium]|nr:ankyrin repeat domain-containing protein [Spirochaetota bacterium]